MREYILPKYEIYKIDKKKINMLYVFQLLMKEINL